MFYKYVVKINYVLGQDYTLKIQCNSNGKLTLNYKKTDYSIISEGFTLNDSGKLLARNPICINSMAVFTFDIMINDDIFTFNNETPSITTDIFCFINNNKVIKPYIQDHHNVNPISFYTAIKPTNEVVPNNYNNIKIIKNYNGINIISNSSSLPKPELLENNTNIKSIIPIIKKQTTSMQFIYPSNLYNGIDNYIEGIPNKDQDNLSYSNILSQPRSHQHIPIRSHINRYAAIMPQSHQHMTIKPQIQTQINKEVTIMPQSQQHMTIRPQIQPQINKEVTIRPQSQQHMTIKPQIQSQINKEVTIRPQSQPQINKEVKIMPQSQPQINKEVTIRPHIPIRPQINMQVPIRPQINREVPIRSHIPIRPQINREVAIQPQINSEVQIIPQIQPQINREVPIQPQISLQSSKDLIISNSHNLNILFSSQSLPSQSSSILSLQPATIKANLSDELNKNLNNTSSKPPILKSKILLTINKIALAHTINVPKILAPKIPDTEIPKPDSFIEPMPSKSLDASKNLLHKIKLHNNIITKFKNTKISLLQFMPVSINTTNLLLTKLKDESSNIIMDIYISIALRRFTIKILQEYGFSSNTNPAKMGNRIVMFGCYNIHDFNFIKKNTTKEITLIWGGTDCNSLANNIEYLTYFRKANNIRHVAISKHIETALHSYFITPFCCIHFRLLNYFDYPRIADIVEEKSAYIYTSLDSKRAKEIYGSDIYTDVIKKMPHINFIVAYGQYSPLEIINTYKRCFIGIRLTTFDGNANTVQELGMLGIKCIHNGEFPNGISWSNSDDIITSINYELENKFINKRQQVRNDMIDYLSKDKYEWLF